MKARKEHRVPLSDRAIAILDVLPRDRDLVFAGERGARLGENALRRVAKRCGVETTIHGLRSAFRDWGGNETGFPRELAEQALAHVTGDATERAYRRSDALERRRKLMDAWSNFCERPPVDGANVVSLRAAQ